jgi:hypothetical protein
MSAVKLRLLKVVCQAVFVIDDGTTLTETAAEPVVVSAAEWPTYATGAFVDAMSRLQDQVERPNDDRPLYEHERP